MSDPPHDQPEPGAVEISGFDLQRRLGAGGMAEVFLAKKRGAEGTFKQLVLKRILPEHSKSRRFRHMFVVVGCTRLAQRIITLLNNSVRLGSLISTILISTAKSRLCAG